MSAGDFLASCPNRVAANFLAVLEAVVQLAGAALERIAHLPHPTALDAKQWFACQPDGPVM